jgi:hypothetical protein
VWIDLKKKKGKWEPKRKGRRKDEGKERGKEREEERREEKRGDKDRKEKGRYRNKRKLAWSSLATIAGALQIKCFLAHFN